MQDLGASNKPLTKTPVKTCHFKKMSGFLMPYRTPPFGHPLPGAGVFLLIVFLIISIVNIARAEEYTNDEIANAIYKAENSVKYPYGIKSINTYGDKDYARKICLNTIRNNRVRFIKQTKYTDFIEFLGSRYCPTTINSEYHLNKNWVRNVKFFLAKTQ